ncbi:NUDIX hydrolase [Sessilibacter corallicola]|uniref:CoA pyrophosphatase n=1 Tax=Sessilibacter corallicola TaxID=2904075 RepID=A0ABQ0A7W0_9GAMM
MSKLLENNLISKENKLVQANSPRMAAVLVGLIQQFGGYSIVLTRRALHLNSHAGEVSLPGGKWEPNDSTLIETALRESEEEVDLPRHLVDVVGCLPERISKLGVRVVPVVGVIEGQPVFTPNRGELDEVFLIPVEYLVSDNRIRTDVFNRGGASHWAPAWQFEHFEVWGLTARILVDLLDYGFGVKLDRSHSAPERVFN